MSQRAPRICACNLKIAAGEQCPCERRRAAARQASRPSANARGYDSKWQRESQAFLALPGNERCACGCGREANVVDHKQAHKGDRRLFWARWNWQPMAKTCNTRKAARTEGGFGNPIKEGGLRISEGGPSRPGATPTRDTLESDVSRFGFA